MGTTSEAGKEGRERKALSCRGVRSIQKHPFSTKHLSIIDYGLRKTLD